MPFFSKAFKSKDKSKKDANSLVNGHGSQLQPQWIDKWLYQMWLRVGESGITTTYPPTSHNGLPVLCSEFARDAFTTFIPFSVDTDARANIIQDFFDLMAAIAAHGKTNGLGGRKLSR